MPRPRAGPRTTFRSARRECTAHPPTQKGTSTPPAGTPPRRETGPIPPPPRVRVRGTKSDAIQLGRRRGMILPIPM